jgi:acyl carrier protein
MPQEHGQLQTAVYDAIKSVMEKPETPFDNETPLIGAGSLLDSMSLVELCVALEDKASDLGFEFDWTSEHAMSRSRSMFRNVGSLVAEMATQQQEAK